MNVTSSQLKDKFRGCLMGMAIGDALGAASEFMNERQVCDAFGVLKDYHATAYFGAGEFTDDTSMALAIADAFLEWMHKDGRGIGMLTLESLRLIERGESPHAAGQRAWERSGKSSAGNGAVMRCAPVGLFGFRDPESLVEDSIATSRITHYDPRCCHGTVAVNSAIAAMLNDTDTFEAAAASIAGKCPELEAALEEAKVKDTGAMSLDGPNMGYTILTTQVAFAALRQFDSLEDGLIAVVNKGGDADTNGAVAGALLGCKFGLESFPKRWVDGLQDAERVMAAADRLYELVVGA